MRQIVLHILQGIGIGAANVIPGVSGGTMALIFGIYERLIEVANDSVTAALALVRLDFRAFNEALRRIPWTFAGSLLAGIVIAPLVGAHIIPTLLETWPEHSRGLFFGLIAGSLAIPWLRTRRVPPSGYGLAILATLGAYYVSGLPLGTMDDPSLLQVFLAAAVAISAMILPGISGAFLLLVMGMYAPILRAVDQREMVVILVFVAGALAGLALFSVLLRWLLRDYHDTTMAALVGLMLGSLRALWPWLGENRSLQLPTSADPIQSVVYLVFLGFAVSGLITLWEYRRSRSRKGQ